MGRVGLLRYQVNDDGEGRIDWGSHSCWGWPLPPWCALQPSISSWVTCWCREKIRVTNHNSIRFNNTAYFLIQFLMFCCQCMLFLGLSQRNRVCFRQHPQGAAPDRWLMAAWQMWARFSCLYFVLQMSFHRHKPVYKIVFFKVRKPALKYHQ